MIGIPVIAEGANPEIDERFGRGNYFCIIDKNNNYNFVENRAREEASGAGGVAVSILVDENVETIIAPHIGPKAMTAIEAVKIRAFDKGEAKTVSDALEMLELGRLTEVTNRQPGLRKA